MPHSRLNRLQQNQKTRKRVFVIFGIFALLIFGRVFSGIIRYTPVLYQLLFQKEISLKKTTDDTVNILLLGIGGGKHDGPNLTDTILFASIDPKNNKVTLVSLPRDLWVPDLNAKINTAYAFGEDKQKGEGLTLAKKTVGTIIGQKIDYGFRLDFNGFIKAVDMIGGLTINVDRSFDDYEYPMQDKENDPCGHKEEELQDLATASSQLEAFPCRYEHLHFNKGITHMDGSTALKYVRSRHALGAEGSDFARSKRQEKVILAFKEKILSLNTLLNPVKLVSLYDIFKDSIDTDIKQDEYDDFIKLAQKMKKAKTQTVVLDYGDAQEVRKGLLINPPLSDDYKGQWVIIPRNGASDYAEIQNYVACQIEKGNCNITPTVTQ